MKHSWTFRTVFLLLSLLCLACQYTPISRFVNQYDCQIPGKPRPTTSDEYVERAREHGNMFSDANFTYDDCTFAALNEALRLNPNNVKALAMRGLGYEDEKRYFWALRDFGSAIEIDPEYADAYGYRSNIYIIQKQYKAAVDDLAKRIELTPKDDNFLAFYYYRRGDTNLKLGNLEVAINDLTKAIEIEPHNSLYYSSRSNAHDKNGNRELAEFDAERMMEAKFAEEGETPKYPPRTHDKNISVTGLSNNHALELPTPEYPEAARKSNVNGEVEVNISVDIDGKVISANAFLGPQLLKPPSEAAAKKALFTPQFLGGKRIKMGGKITYKFE